MYDKKYHVGLIGDSYFLDTAINAWLAGGRLEDLSVCDKNAFQSAEIIEGVTYYRDEFEMLASAGLDALEFASGEAVDAAILGAAAKIALPMAVSGTLADTYAGTLNVLSMIGTSRAPFMYIDALTEHPFVDRALLELKRDGIGEVQILRMKSQVGKVNFRCKDENGFNPLLRREFERSSIIEKFFGSVNEVYCQSGRDSWLLSYRFGAPGRYAFTEALVSPDLQFSCEGPHADDSLEITGTDGIIWLRNLSGLLVEAPRFAMKRRDETIIVDDRIEYSQENREMDLRLRFLEMIENKNAASFDAASIVRAARLAEAARISALESRPVRPEEIPYP